MYSRCNEAFDKIHKLWLCESEQCQIVTALGFATGPTLNRSERQSLTSNHDLNCYEWQWMLIGQCVKMSLYGASTICSCVSTVINQWFGRCHA